MESNLYDEFRDHHSFDAVRDLVVNSLENRLPSETGDAYDEHEDEVEGVLSTLSWGDLERRGQKTRRETMMATYGYERPGFKLFIMVCFDSETRELEKTVVRVTVGYDIESMNFGTSDGERETARYIVASDGRVV